MSLQNGQRIFPIVDSRVRSEVCPMFFRVGTGDTLDQALRAAGLVDVQLSHPPTTIQYANADVACDAAFLSGPVALAYSRFDELTRFSVRAEYLASIEPWRDGRAFQDSRYVRYRLWAETLRRRADT